MAVEVAGVELIAKNYREYVQQLKTVDKLQQQVFAQRSDTTTSAHQRAANAAKDQKNQVSVLNQAYRTLQGTIVAALSVRGIQAFMEFTQKAFDFQRITTQFENLAASGGQSAQELANAFQRAAQGGISSSRAMGAALAAMRLEVAGTPSEIEELVRIAVALRPPTKSAADAVDEFVTALGRRSLLVLDNFNISSRQARREMERLAQVKYGKPLSELDKAASDALFMEAALKVARRQYEAMGGASVEVVSSQEKLNASLENAGTIMGQTLLPLASSLAGKLEEAATTFAKIVVLARVDAARQRAEIEATNRLLAESKKGYQYTYETLAGGGFAPPTRGKLTPEQQAKVAAAGEKAAMDEAKEAVKALGIFTDEAGNKTKDFTDNIEDNTAALEASKSALDRAASIQRSYARSIEDALRRAGRAANKLQRQQDKELVNLKTDLDKNLAKAQKNADKQAAKERKDQNKQIKREQDDLLRTLRQAQERYDLDRLQSQRRFRVSDRRLRSEGDILALMDLREDFDLQQKEAKENFDLQQKQQKESGKTQIDQQAEDAREQLDQLQADLAERKQELYDSYDEELALLKEKHAEQREDAAKGLAEQLEDLRLNRQRQLEDLGYALAQEENLTAEGAKKVAGVLQDFYGEEGVADTVMSGFYERNQDRILELQRSMEQLLTTSATEGVSPSTLSMRTGRIPRRGMQHGFSGVVTGPQNFYVEPGVREFVYAQPLRGGSSSLNVNMSGGFNITGGGPGSEAVIEAAADRIALDLEVAVRRLVRRG